MDMAKSRRLFWLLVMLVILASSAAAAAIYVLLNHQGAATAHAGEVVEASTAEEPEAAEPIYLELKPFTVNLAEDDSGPRMLYVGITLQVGTEASSAAIERERPLVRNRLMLMLSGRKAEDLVTPQGKEQLATDLTTGLSELLADNHSVVNINRVLFTEFIVQ